MRCLAILALMFVASPATAQERPLATFDWFDLRGSDPIVGAFDQHEDFGGDGPRLDPLTPLPSTERWWSLANGALQISASEEPLWSRDGPSLLGRPVELQEYSATTLLDYSDLQAGDVAGIVARRDESHWISIQIERIEPADLIAVRLRDGEASPPAGRLVSTTALPGSLQGRVKLRIDGNAGDHTLMFADERGLWQILAEGLEAPFLRMNGDGQPSPWLIGLFATDGAERN